jgi:hypothetical protein
VSNLFSIRDSSSSNESLKHAGGIHDSSSSNESLKHAGGIYDYKFLFESSTSVNHHTRKHTFAIQQHCFELLLLNSPILSFYLATNDAFKNKIIHVI